MISSRGTGSPWSRTTCIVGYRFYIARDHAGIKSSAGSSGRNLEGVAMAGPRVGVYAISVAAEMAGTNVQNLRVYERKGLVAPGRTAGGTRLYSRDDVDRLHRIRDLLDLGLNLAGIALVLQLEAENGRLRREVGRLRDASHG
jgi:hypothetical protein